MVNVMKKDVKLYNVLFPFWMLLLFPQMWLIVLPGNFIIDSLVLLISMAVLKISDKKQWYKKHILKIYAFGLLADVIGSAYMLLMMVGFELGRMGGELYLTTFRKADKGLRLKFALAFAIVTAPYTFLIPSSWLY